MSRQGGAVEAASELVTMDGDPSAPFAWPGHVDRSGEDRRATPRPGVSDRRQAPADWARGYHDGLDGRPRQAPPSFTNVECQAYYCGYTSGVEHAAVLVAL